MTTNRTILVVVSGRVQGVGYRAWARDEARRRGISGWVRNQSDGSVKALLSGAPEDVAGMVDALREGPLGASVTEIRQEDTDEPAAAGFEIRR